MENLELELEKNRQTEIVEPYKLPDGWKWCRLGDVCKFENGYAFKSDKFAEHGTPVIRITNIKDNEVSLDDCAYTTETSIDERFLVKKGDLLIAMSGATTGKNGIYCNDDKAYLNQRVGNIKVIDTNVLCDKYRNYYIQSKEQEILLSAYGGAQPNISSNKISAMAFPLPPTLAEQQRIVNRIETMFAKLDQAQEKAQTVLDSFETRKAAIFHKAFTGQLRIDNEELKIEDWEEKSFSDLGTSNLGKMLDQNKNTGDEIRYLRNINVRWFDFDLSDLLTMRAKPEEIKKLSVKKGDLFICEGGEPGRCAVWKDENADLIFQKAIHRFRPNDGVSSDFVAYVLYYYNQIGKLSDYFTGTTIKHLTGQSLAKLPIKLPPLNYQLSIVNFLDIVLEKESRAKEAAQTVLDQIALLKKSILARAFRGEL